MRFNQFILGLLFIIIGAHMNAQTIKGIVTDENGQALPYSNVVDKATANGVTTTEMVILLGLRDYLLR
jgi:iron complex outermembrane receptor protein